MTVHTMGDHHHYHDGDLPGEPLEGHRHAPRWLYWVFAGAVGVLLLLYWLSVVTSVFGVDVALLLTVVAGFPLIRHAIDDLLRGHLSTHLTIAIAAVAAIAVGEYFAAAEVMFIMLVGEGLEDLSVDRAKRAISGFVRVQPKLARVRRDDAEIEVDPAEVAVDEEVIVRAGETIPVDGVVLKGRSSVQQSLITGEPVPVTKQPGDQVFSGSVNEHGPLEVRAEKVGADTTVSRIAHLIRSAQANQAPIQRTADRLSRYFLPAVVVAGALVYLLTGEVLRTVAALVVACPCALVLATPAAMAAAIARLALDGIMVKGGSVVERLAHVTSVAFDKTGTLTAGRPTVAGVSCTPGFDEAQMLELAASAESPSEHLLGREIVREAERRELTVAEPDEFEIHPGLGVEATVGGQRVWVGNLELARDAGATELEWAEDTIRSHAEEGATGVVVVVDDRVAGVVALRDALRPGAAEAVSELERLGVARISMLTGDADRTAKVIAGQAGIREVYSRLLPDDKTQKIRELRDQGLVTLMVGDGINDAPSLATADVGLAMGRGAADISAEAAHAVLIRDRLDQIPELVAYSRTAISRIRSSILVFAFGVNFGAVLAAAFGLLGPAAAAIVHQVTSLAVILNSMRLLVRGGRTRDRLVSRVGSWWRAIEHAISFDGLRRGLDLVRTYHRDILLWGAGVAGALWLGSTLSVIAPDEVGVVQRLGRLVQLSLEPGVHLRWPWPVERVTRVQPHLVRSVEVGYRRDTAASGAPAPAFEWNIRHTEGPVVQVLEESVMLTGDENLVEAYGVVEFSISDPARYLFGARNPERTIRATAERTLRWRIAVHELDEILTVHRGTLETEWRSDLQQALDGYRLGIRVLATHLEHVHPPFEVVAAYRDVASAQEERTTAVNRAEAYTLEQIPLARGQGRAQVTGAEGYRDRRVHRSRGESQRFEALARAHTAAPSLTTFRLYLEGVEEVLPAKQKYIVAGRSGGRRRFVFFGSESMDLLQMIAPDADRQPTGAGASQRLMDQNGRLR
jgi:Cu+-exporting ATPase